MGLGFIGDFMVNMVPQIDVILSEFRPKLESQHQSFDLTELSGPTTLGLDLGRFEVANQQS